jgi:hypothetical protein
MKSSECDKAESRIQQEIVMWFRNNYCLKHHDPRNLIFSIPNERNNAREMAAMKATGLMKGAADLVVVMPNRVIFVEVKTATGQQSPAQKEFEKSVKALGFEYFLVRSLQEFRNLAA